MKLIIAGSRNIDKYRAFYEAFIWLAESPLESVEFVTGCCPTGADQVPLMLPDAIVHEFPADWKKHGKAAGPVRNKEMAKFADALLLIWDGKSSGSRNIKIQMLKLDKPVYEVKLNLGDQNI